MPDKKNTTKYSHKPSSCSLY